MSMGKRKMRFSLQMLFAFNGSFLLFLQIHTDAGRGRLLFRLTETRVTFQETCQVLIVDETDGLSFRRSSGLFSSTGSASASSVIDCVVLSLSLSLFVSFFPSSCQSHRQMMTFSPQVLVTCRTLCLAKL